ncbi:LacI family transcriptional regulator [Rhizobiaceae bacterium BDR2-2]|uniref:LacI family transcriptional regulator n=1 Tax=Ectorhizobium quercum TaxID=2965071 RepID=A0AAE3N4K7_9HYPH|nr:LacI family DNA-binding transcriptional regulator [Ectorhizobium quercum]MCX8999569.1 LacI family transcriptional regulator [Ectorhizobium quercum]
MPPQKQAANLGDIARALGVSVATVSNALSGKGRVSASLVPRVREMADRMGYVPSLAGRALRTGRTGVLGLVLPDIANPLFPQIAQAIEFAAGSAGYGTLIGDSRGDSAVQTEAIHRLVERGVDGLVVVPRRGTRISDADCPVAVIDSPSTPGNTVSADHRQGGALVGAHLAALGHRRVLLLGNNPASAVQNDRLDGMRDALSGHAEVEVLWIEPYEREREPGSLLDLAGHVAAGVTAVAAVSDLHALRAVTELHRAGHRVPEDVSVTGFDDLSWSGAITPALTTVRADMLRIATIAVSSLVRVIEGKDEAPDGFVVSTDATRVPMSLVVRQTSGPVRRTSYEETTR